MNNIYCLEIEFSNIDFSSYYINGELEISTIHYAELCTKPDKIELKIFYDEKSCFDRKLGQWLNTIDFKKFGSYLKIDLAENDTNDHLQKIDLSETRLFALLSSSDYYEEEHKYIILNISTVKFYFDSYPEKNNTAEFYLDEKGFRVSAPFYTAIHPTTFFKNDGQFQAIRMKDSEDFFKLDKSLFRPEFNFNVKDNKTNREATIIKEPKIQFNYLNETTEKEALFYGDVVLMLASFYHHIKIDFTVRRIHLPSNTITIKNIENRNYIDRSGSLKGFGIDYSFNKFLKTSWQSETLKNYNLLSKAVTLFNQSLIVDNASAFLIRYNIIEICGKTNAEDSVWNFTIKNDELDTFFNKIKNNICDIIDQKEQEYFDNKWISILNIIKSKSLRKQLEDALTKNNINAKLLPIKTNKIVQLRNIITHGSTEKIDVELLNKANVLLYRICGILILNLMGNKDWKLNTEIN